MVWCFGRACEESAKPSFWLRGAMTALCQVCLADPLASILCRDSWLDVMGSSDRDHAVRQLHDLRSALFSSLPDTSSSLHPLWDASLSSATQDAVACCQMLQDEMQDVPVGLIPLVSAVASATRSVVKEWISKCSAASQRFKKRPRPRKRCRRVQHMRVAAAQSGPVAQRAQPTPQPIGSVKGFVLNFGLSGGMNPSGDMIATNTWWCAASYLPSLGAHGDSLQDVGGLPVWTCSCYFQNSPLLWTVMQALASTRLRCGTPPPYLAQSSGSHKCRPRCGHAGFPCVMPKFGSACTFPHPGCGHLLRRMGCH